VRITVTAEYDNGCRREVAYQVASKEQLSDLFDILKNEAWNASGYADAAITQANGDK
jgi:hypothetical protein